MTTIQNYLAELVLAQLNGRKPVNIPENITTDEIIDIAGRNHMIYPLLGALIKTDNVPEEKVNDLRFKIQNSILMTLAQVTELNKLVTALENAGIKNQPMKGSCMKFMYPSPELREMSDIDILIAGEQMDAAGKVMLELGYTLAQSIKHHDK